ncbi:tryptophan 2,3-dioxygenase [Phyllobacterium endophyticum]|uniref:Tryptophan 2,3-dioxygenase n=1 Tax=Phyllobacterium endophyticum TaxID=1149773 RepID=A0A2P7APE8_9HYPH|nr:tryptophan 2,3-dioxygenase [Phyllobacterium endophyticum]MBB3233551.1 tryptophan 2,3-dioxygenase [Phyllobacterium endophyticum]PSH56074.1 tryptophan 2,3-dioxygenase [Phyllobacterium endophyticum]TYR41226.1 tryptophan 2,3-dioxygenase [Phyllobacterium endophyticum]
MTRTPYDPESEGAQMAFKGRMSYGDYLQLDKILTAQTPLSQAHDEMLFIVQHQASEIWMRLVIHELTSVCEHIARDDLAPSFKKLARVSRILDQLNSAWDVLRTMTPSEYTTFREALGMSSGFQSFQYRAIEFLAGNKNAAMMRAHEHKPDIHSWLAAFLHAPSIYDQSIRLLARKGLAIDKSLVDRDWSLPYQPNDSVREAWLVVYRDPEAHWPLYELAEKLVDFEDYFRRWRFNHVTTVERIIGFKSGTGGTSGVNYLRKMLEVVLFPELWSVRTNL